MKKLILLLIILFTVSCKSKSVVIDTKIAEFEKKDSVVLKEIIPEINDTIVFNVGPGNSFGESDKSQAVDFDTVKNVGGLKIQIKRKNNKVSVIVNQPEQINEKEFVKLETKVSKEVFKEVEIKKRFNWWLLLSLVLAVVIGYFLIKLSRFKLF